MTDGPLVVDVVPNPPPRTSVPARPTSVELVDHLLHSGARGGSRRLALATRTADGWEEWTYGDLDRRCTGVAVRLRASGVGPGDRVVLLGPAGGSWLAVLLGILRCGAVAVPLDPRLTPAELGPILVRTAPAALIASGGLAAVLMEAWPQDDGSTTPFDLDHLAALGIVAGDADLVGPAPWAARQAHDAAMVVWTSGTTGAPKGVTLSFANLAYSVGQSVAAQGPRPDDRWLSVLPPHHLLELCCGVLPALATGACVFFARTLMPHEIAQIIRARQLTTMVAVPLLLRILEHSLPGSGLQTAYCGGAPLDPGVVDRYASRGIAVYQGYGLTEAAPTVSMNTPDHHRTGSVGRPLAGTEVRVDGPAGAGAGEILVRSPAVMLGYWGDDALTASMVDADGWLHTGDLGHLDGDGFLHVTGRAKRLVVLESGKKVQPEEVEQALGTSELFAEVCVVAVGGGAAGSEQVCAVVVPSTTLVARHLDDVALYQEVEAEVARRASSLSGYKRPTLIEIDQGPLPRTIKGSVRHDEVARVVGKRRGPSRP